MPPHCRLVFVHHEGTQCEGHGDPCVRQIVRAIPQEKPATSQEEQCNSQNAEGLQRIVSNHRLVRRPWFQLACA